MNKKIKLVALVGLASFLMVACSQSQATSSDGTLWSQIIALFAAAIRALSLGGQTGVGIILFTIILRVVMLPLYNMQLKSSQKMQDLQPELRALQTKYAGQGRDGQAKLAEETQALQKKHGVKMSATWIPLLIQMPILMALYYALSSESLTQSASFLWLDLSKPDPYFILPLFAALFTFLASWLTNKAAREKNAVMTVMNYFMPLFIGGMGLGLASGVVLYWTVSNACQVLQILALNNPFKIIAQREAEAAAEKERQAKIRRAKKKAQKKRK